MLTKQEFEEYWNVWSQHEETNYKLIKDKSGVERRKYLKKGYTHFDHKFWFPDRKDELKEVLENGLKVYSKKNRQMEWWSFRPFLKVLLKTPRYKYQEAEGHYDLETKIRPICFASHFDSLIFGFYAFALTKKYEAYIKKEGFEEIPLAYRSNLGGKCNIQFAKEVIDEIKIRGACSAIALDIKGYFDHIDHVKLKEKWTKMIGGKLPPDQYKLFKALTEYSYVNKNSILKKYHIDLSELDHSPSTILELVPGSQDYEKYQKLRSDKLIVTNNKPQKESGRFLGIPQGSGMSAILSNIYLIDFDKDMYERGRQNGFFYRRYCDDIIIICDSEVADQLQKEIIDKIDDEYYLKIQDKKVELTEFRPNSKNIIRAFNKKKQNHKGILSTNVNTEKMYYKSFQYLGFEYNGQNIYIRPSSLSRYFRKMKGRIIKTIVMSYSDKSKSDSIWKKQIFERYSHLGNRNFLTYAYNSSKELYKNKKGEMKIGMNSPSIRKQLSRHFDILKQTLNAKNDQRFSHKKLKGGTVKKKNV